MLVAAWLLVLHLFVPPAPYGSWEARARPDPGGGWRMPRRVWHAAWIGWALENGLAALNGSRALLVSPSEPMAFGGLAMIGWLLQVFVVAAAIHPPLRRPAWSAMWIWQIAWLSATGWAGSAPSFAMLHLLAVDPGWLAARSWLVPSDSTVERSCSPRVARLFYDGECGFCHRSVRFVLAEEGPSPDALRFRFAPLESPAFAEMLERHPGLAGSLPDSIVLELEDGTIRTRATAALEIASRLGGLWRLLSIAGRGLPRAALDRGYDTLARVRKRIFARPKASCPIVPPAMRERFEL
jgi:predicted DCC family thiol-disulfide oxidoreductase YuxK